MKSRKLIFAAVAAVALTSCGDKVRVWGCFAGAPDQSIYLQIVSPATKEIIDSTQTDSRGNFSMRIELPDGQPTIYDLVCKDQTIPLLLAPREKVHVSSIYGIGMNYTINGSEGSEKLRELELIFFNGQFSLDSLRNLYAAEEHEPHRQAFAREYSRTYYRIKRAQIGFLVDNCHSLAAIYALYQHLPNDNNSLTGCDDDLIYYRMVADSVAPFYPDSPYLTALRREIESSSAAKQAKEQLMGNKIKTVNHPEISLPDMYGKVQSLSALDGKVTLLLFWSVTGAGDGSASGDAAMLNAELKELYTNYSGKGFDIYQVCVDRRKAPWVDAVQRQKLPWTNVCDLKGMASPAVAAYNVTSVPTCYLVDRHGDIAARDLFGAELEKKVRELTDK